MARSYFHKNTVEVEVITGDQTESIKCFPFRPRMTIEAVRAFAPAIRAMVPAFIGAKPGTSMSDGGFAALIEQALAGIIEALTQPGNDLLAAACILDSCRGDPLTKAPGPFDGATAQELIDDLLDGPNFLKLLKGAITANVEAFVPLAKGPEVAATASGLLVGSLPQ